MVTNCLVSAAILQAARTVHPLAAPQKDFCWRPLRLRLLKVWITQNQRATQKSCGAGHHKIDRGWVEWSDGGVWSWAGATASGGATKEVATSAAPTLRKPPGRSPGGPFLGLGQLGSHQSALASFSENCAYATLPPSHPQRKGKCLRRRTFLCRFISRLWSGACLQTCTG